MADREAGIVVRIKGDDKDFQKTLDTAAKKSQDFSTKVGQDVSRTLPQQINTEAFANKIAGSLSAGFGKATKDLSRLLPQPLMADAFASKITGTMLPAIGSAQTAFMSLGMSSALLATGVGVVVGVLSAVTAAATTMAFTIGTAAVSYASFADQISNQSMATGMAIDKLTVLNQAFKNAGQGSGAVGNLLSSMQNAISNASSETENYSREIDTLKESLLSLEAIDIPVPQLVDTEGIEAEIKKLKYSRIPTPQLLSTRGLKGEEYEAVRQQNAMAKEQVATQKLQTRQRLDELNKQLSDAKRNNAEMLRSYERSQNQMAKSTESTQKQIAHLADKGGKASKAFKELGLDISELSKLDPDQQFEAMAEAFQKVADATKRVSLARDIFGRGGAAMALPVLLDQEQMTLSRRMLGSLSAYAKESAAEVGRMWTIVTEKPGILMKQLGAGLLTAITRSSSLKDAVEKIIDLDFGPLGERIGSALQSAVTWFQDLFASDNPFNDFASKFEQVAMDISGYLVKGFLHAVATMAASMVSMGEVNKLGLNLTLALVGAAVTFGEALKLAFDIAVLKMENSIKGSWLGRAFLFANTAVNPLADKSGVGQRLKDVVSGRSKTDKELDDDIQARVSAFKENSLGGKMISQGLEGAAGNFSNIRKTQQQFNQIAATADPTINASGVAINKMNALRQQDAVYSAKDAVTLNITNESLKQLVVETKTTNALIEQYFSGLLVR